MPEQALQQYEKNRFEEQQRLYGDAKKVLWRTAWASPLFCQPKTTFCNVLFPFSRFPFANIFLPPHVRLSHSSTLTDMRVTTLATIAPRHTPATRSLCEPTTRGKQERTWNNSNGFTAHSTSWLIQQAGVPLYHFQRHVCHSSNSGQQPQHHIRLPPAGRPFPYDIEQTIHSKHGEHPILLLFQHFFP